MIKGWIGGETFSPDETIDLGKVLAKYLEPSDIICLDGGLASGKTTFVKGILIGLGYKSDVTSPTFTLINEYEAKYNVVHMDCYREDNIQRWISLGIQEYLYSEDIKIIEWPTIISELIPKNTIMISFESISENKRIIRIK